MSRFMHRVALIVALPAVPIIMLAALIDPYDTPAEILSAWIDSFARGR